MREMRKRKAVCDKLSSLFDLTVIIGKLFIKTEELKAKLYILYKFYPISIKF